MGSGDTEARAATTPPGRRALTFAHAVLVAAFFLSLSQVVFAVQTHRPALLWILPLALAAVFAAAFLLKPANRLLLALTLLPIIPLVYGFEWRIAVARPYDANVAARRGVTYDTRSVWEVIRDTRREGTDAYPSFQPRELLVQDLRKAVHADEAQSHELGTDWGVMAGGERLLPLGGLSNRRVVTCNEGGTYAGYDSDERGFNNPRGLWALPTVDVVLLGDSFTQGACVNADENAAHWIRARYPATLNLGMAGNGPLLELAGLLELAAEKKPKVVLWIYYANDMMDLQLERGVPLLHRYLEEDGFSQGLSTKQAQIDEALLALSRRIDAIAPRWPGWLESVGLTRKRAPVSFGDLVMGESHASATAVLRLDRLAFGLSSRLVVDYNDFPPDFPLFKRVLTRAKSRVEGWGGRLYVVYMAEVFFMHYGKGREHPLRAPVLAAVKEAGVPLIDAQPVFFDAPDSSKLVYFPESHTNPAGYRLLAEVILRGMEER